MRERTERLQSGAVVRVQGGDHKGQVGTVVRLVEDSTPAVLALVSFPDDTSDYCRVAALKQVGRLDLCPTVDATHKPAA